MVLILGLSEEKEIKSILLMKIVKYREIRLFLMEIGGYYIQYFSKKKRKSEGVLIQE